MNRIMVLGASVLQVPIIERAKALGYYVIAVDMNPEATGFQYADKALVISTIDTEAIFNAAKSEGIEGIITAATDMPIRSVAVVAERLGLVGISEDTAMHATDKYLMRNRLSEHGVPVPKFNKISSLDAYSRVVASYAYPYIVKPVDSSGSRGVFLVKSEQTSLEGYHYAKKHSRSGDILVEDYLQGREISVETVSSQKEIHFVAITDKQTTGPPYFVEVGHSQPTTLDSMVQQRVREVTRETIHALGIENGPAHTELIITADGPKVVEIGARLGGGSITSHLVPLSTGIDLLGLSIKIAMNEEIEVEPGNNGASAVRFFTPGKGVIQAINGIEDALGVEGVVKVDFFKGVGDQVEGLRNGADRVGFVIAAGKSEGEAMEACERAIDLIDVKMTLNKV